MDTKNKRLLVFVFISMALIGFSVVITILSWNYFNAEVEVPVYNGSVPVGGGKVNFGIIPANKSGILNSTDLINENG